MIPDSKKNFDALSGPTLAKDLHVILGCDLSHIKLPLALCGVSHISGMIQPVLPYYWNTSASQAGGPTPRTTRVSKCTSRPPGCEVEPPPPTTRVSK